MSSSIQFPTGPFIDPTTNDVSLEWRMWLQNPQFLVIPQATLSGDVTTPGGGSTTTSLKNTGTAGTYTKTTFDAQGRETSGGVAAASDLSNGTTGTGAIVLAGTPSLTTPNLGVPRSVGGVLSSGSIGVPVVVASGRATAQIASNASVSTFTVGASDGSFEISANVNVTTSTLHNFTVTCTYTDENSVLTVLTLGFTQLSGATFLTAITNVTGAGAYEGLVYHIRCKAATAITIATTGTFTTVVYNAEGLVKQMA